MKSADSRNKLAKHNIILSIINKGIAALVSLIFVSATVDYLNPVNYGIWITISSIVIWAGYFDLGIQHGFRNHLTRAFSNDDRILAKELVSTSYIIISVIYLLILIISYIIISVINWKEFLHLNIANYILKDSFFILFGFFAIQAVLNLIQTILTSDQRPAYAALIYTFGQICALLGVYYLIHNQSDGTGSLISLSWIIGGIPVIVFLIFSFLLFKTRYKEISPSVHNYNKSLIRKITGLGSKFFLIQISLLIIFQSASVIITKNIGPEDATIFNVAYKYIGIVYMGCVIVLTPFWSAFTDAYEKKDYEWMIRTYESLKKRWIIVIPTLAILVCISKFVYSIWLKDKVDIPLNITICMAIYMLCMTRGALYMFLINGIGKVTLQMIIYLSFAIISIPIMYFTSIVFGLKAIILYGAFVYLVQAIIGQIQLKRILERKAQGIWNK